LCFVSFPKADSKPKPTCDVPHQAVKGPRQRNCAYVVICSMYGTPGLSVFAPAHYSSREERNAGKTAFTRRPSQGERKFEEPIVLMVSVPVFDAVFLGIRTRRESWPSPKQQQPQQGQKPQGIQVSAAERGCIGAISGDRLAGVTGRIR